jgi:hypothetical protein
MKIQLRGLYSVLYILLSSIMNPYSSVEFICEQFCNIFLLKKINGLFTTILLATLNSYENLYSKEKLSNYQNLYSKENFQITKTYIVKKTFKLPKLI